ncbi:MAG: right-handed parallel beta-helix repeat-containing protein [Acidobacteria bacterium]|nr:right-handed parallel beta-helix repeat-containing protein [Acidobacteriota bacterium]
MSKGVLAFYCFGLLVFGGLCGERAAAATRTVDTVSDNGALTACTNAAGDCSLRGAIAASAAAGDTINFDAAVFGTIQTIQIASTLTINKSLTVSGTNRNLLTIARTGAAVFPVLTLQSGTIQISDLTIANGSGGIDNFTATTTLTRVILTGNAGPGVAIRPGGSVTLRDSTVSNNTSTLGGGLFIMTDALGDYARATVDRTTISGNTATQSGGGIYNAGVLNVTNSTISGNTAGTFGGGIFAQGGTFDNTGGHVNYSTITDNHAGASGGGGIFALSGRRIVVANSIVAGNTNTGNSTPDIANGFQSDGHNLVGNPNGSSGYVATDLTNVNPQLGALADNGGLNRTHAIPCTSPAADVADPAFSFATDQRGGARPANGLPDIGAYEIDCARNNNNSGGGSLRQAIADAPDGGTIAFDPVFFSQPRTIALGGAVIDFFKNLTINGPGAGLLTIDGENLSRVFNVDAVTLNLRDVRLTRGNPGPNIDGGAILINNNGTLNATAIVVDASRANRGGGIYVLGTLNLTGSTVTGCTADQRGGGIWSDAASAVTLTGATVSGNHADDRGGGLGSSGSLIVRSSTVSGNTATRPAGTGGSPAGGGIYTDGYLALYDSTVSGNTAQLGGGLFNRRFVLDGYTDIRNSTFAGNSAIQTGNGADVNGGAIYADGDYIGGSTATVDAKNTTFAGNSAAGAGGAIFMQQFTGNNPVFNLENSIVAGNTASSGPDLSGRITSYGYNLITSTSGSTWSPSSPTLAGNIIGPAGGARLAPLGNYGGPTQTMALLADSPAIDGGNPANPFAADQRGAARPIGARVDIGAVERNIAFDQPSLPNGRQNSFYNQQLSATRQTSLAGFAENEPVEGFAPTQFAVVAAAGQSLPPGVTLSPAGLLSGTPTAQGSFTFTVKATDTDGMAGVQQYSLAVLVPTAAAVSVSGRVATADGRAVTNALVTLTDAGGNSRTVRTGSFGYYRFDDVAVGETCVVTVMFKRTTVASAAVPVTDEIADLNFTVNQ